MLYPSSDLQTKSNDWMMPMDNNSHVISQLPKQLNRPFSKMAAENSNELKLPKIKNIYMYQH